MEWLPAALLLVVLALVWTWWAWRQGAYFGVVFYPGAIALAVVLMLLLAVAPWRASLRSSRGAAICLIALMMLAAWTLLSMLWSPAPDEALSDGGRVLLYALSFVLGLWLVHLLAGRRLLSLLPLAAAGGLAALATAITLITGEDLERYLGEFSGTLKFPIGYRNANAAFFLIALWPAVALAASHQVDWRLRGAMLGCATLCAEVAVLSQSRGSILALLAAVFVWLLLSPWRLRALAWVVLAFLPAAAALPWLLDVYQEFKPDEPTLPAIGAAGWAMIATSGAAVALGALFARLEPEPGDARAISRPLLAPLAAGVGACLLAAVAILFAAGEDPVDFVNQRVAEAREAQTPRLSGASRFTINAGSTRSELWRVAWADARDSPVLGEGAGGFEHSFLRDRRINITARDAHSVELELASELGFPGVAMFAAVMIGAAAAGLRSRRLDPASATLAAAALAAGAYWLAHASIDWFWTYPALTAPMFGLLGSAAAPAVLDPRRAEARRARIAVAVAVIAAAVAAVPLYLSERYTNDAYDNWRSDLQQAYDDLDRAANLNPFADEPLQADGAIAREAGNRERAVKAFRAAIERAPDEWASHYLLGRLLEQDDPDRAQRELATAAELNPRSEMVRRALSEVRNRRGE
jgi:O-antigen ligase